MKDLSWVIVFLILIGCGPCKTLTEQHERVITKTVKETVRDTVVTTVADSTYYSAWIECRDNQPVLLKPQKSTFKGPLKAPKVTLTNNQLVVSCEKEAEEIFVRWKEKYITEHVAEQKTIRVSVPRELNWWQKLWINTGKIIAGIGVIIIGIKLWHLKRPF